ncbi:MAG TPA: hypothetical protein VMS93_14050 [Candidatus Saccharimonadales bacterium]|nr:hypothetical protein [Candidatus Saccharimonadales bacterium]
MKRVSFVLAVLALAALPLALASAAEMKHQHAAAGPSALDPIKKLAGEWVGKAGPAGGKEMDAAVTYHVTASGSAVMETLFPGTDHEMVTMYTLDKGNVVLTHYCDSGNQPRMKARKGTPANELVFDFAGGANLDPGKDRFMHNAKMVLVDDRHLRSEWTSWQGGKEQGTVVLKLERKK